MKVGGAGRVVMLGIVIAFGLAGPHLGNYDLNLLTVMFTYAIAVIGLDVVSGFGGLLSMGQGGFFGVGCYAVAVGLAHSTLPGLVLILIGVAVSAALALIIGLAVADRGQTISALVTLAFALIVSSLIGGLNLTGGPTGLPVRESSLFPGLTMTPSATFEVALICVALLLLIVAAVRQGTGGRALAACRYNSKLAASCGVDVRAHRLTCFVLGSALAAVGGALFAYGEAFVSPSSVGLTQSVQFLMMMVIGGSGTGWGALIGAALIAGLPGEVQSLGNWQLFGTGAISLAVLIWFRRGIAGSIEYWISSWRRSRHGRGAVSIVPENLARTSAAAGADGHALVGANISRRFSGIAAVTDMQIDVGFGEIHGLIGPNGAGKTTMMNLLSGADRADTGQVLLDGTDVTKKPAHARATHGLARTFQHATLIPGLSTLDNVLLGAHKRIGHRVIPAVQAVLGFKRLSGEEQDALGILAELGLDEVALKPGYELTAGQRRLAEVARCVMSGGRVLLLDEPAAGLNETETAHLGTVLVELARAGRAILLVEHDMSLVMAVSDRITVMEQGFRLETGSPQKIAASAAVVQAYLGV